MSGLLVALGLAMLPSINIEAVAACMDIEDDGGRLACYDLQLGRQPAAPPAPRTSAGSSGEPAVAPMAVPPPAPAAAQSLATPATPEAGFGLTAEQRAARTSRTADGGKIDHITAVVRSTQMTATGRLLLTLENGQQWVQVESSSRQRFFEGDSITIRKASLGSFLASGPKSGTGVRVRRIDTD